MCNPALAVAALATVGSVAANKMGNDAIARKQASYQGWENNRQNAFQSQIMDTVGKETDKFKADQFASDMDAKRQELASAFTNAISSNDKFLPAAGVIQTPSIVTDDANKKLNKSNDYTGNLASTRANVQSLGDVMFNNNLALAQGGNQVRQIGNFMQGSANVLPLEMQSASRVAAGHRMVADVLQAIGSAAMTSGLAAPTSATGVPTMAQSSATPLSAARAKELGITWTKIAPGVY